MVLQKKFKGREYYPSKYFEQNDQIRCVSGTLPSNDLVFIHRCMCLCRSFGIQIADCEIWVHSKTENGIWEGKFATRLQNQRGCSWLQTWQKALYLWELSYRLILFDCITNTMCQGTQEESFSTPCWVINVQTSVPALDLEVAHELLKPCIKIYSISGITKGI